MECKIKILKEKGLIDVKKRDVEIKISLEIEADERIAIYSKHEMEYFIIKTECGNAFQRKFKNYISEKCRAHNQTFFKTEDIMNLVNKFPHSEEFFLSDIPYELICILKKDDRYQIRQKNVYIEDGDGGFYAEAFLVTNTRVKEMNRKKTIERNNNAIKFLTELFE